MNAPATEAEMQDGGPLPNIVVPAFPYEGALYWLLGEATNRHQREHPYYASLYGPAAPEVMGRATALACLFDRIELASADHAYPDDSRHGAGSDYFHPVLRISSSWNDREWSAEGESFFEFAEANGIFQRLASRRHSPIATVSQRRHFVCRLVQQVRIAIRKRAVLVGDAFFQEVYQAARPHLKPFIDDTPGALLEHHALTFSQGELSAIGLDFGVQDFDSFLAVRDSREIAAYAREFRTAIGEARGNGQVGDKLISLMREAMDQERVAAHAAGAFSAVGSVSAVAGLIPGVGTIAGVIGLGSDALNRAATRESQEQSWYLLGPKMREVSLKAALKRRLE